MIVESAAPERPSDRSWTVAIYAGGEKPVGSGVLIDRRRVLTARHVVQDHEVGTLQVAFPAATEQPFGDPIRVEQVDAASHERADVAILTLAAEAPGDVYPATLRRPRAQDLVGCRWWAYGFRDATGNSAHGVVGEDLAYGWIRLDSQSRYHLEQGFSGAGIWCPDYGAVVGLVGQALPLTGDGRALTMRTATLTLPGELEKLTDGYGLQNAGAEAAAEWGWQLATDPEGHRHWRPRARGASHDGQAGWRFRGRRAALDAIVGWLIAEHVPRTPLVVTGAPGSGKSAVVARIVTTADAQVVRALPPDDTAVRAPIGSIGCAVHAKGKTALDVAREIARAASAAMPTAPDETASQVRIALGELNGTRRFVIVVDALDEATNSHEARLIIRDVLQPLAEGCADIGVRVLVGARRHDDGGDLIATFGNAANEIDLDRPEYVDASDVMDYALATLQLTGEPRPDNPYNDDDLAKRVAERIAEVSVPNFLVAGLVARQHGLHDLVPVEPASIHMPGEEDRVRVALEAYLARMDGVGSLSPAQVLLPLAYAETPGLTPELWSTAIEGLLGVTVDDALLREFASSAAANFLIQTSEGYDSFRLFHQALNDTLIRNRDHRADQAALTTSFMEYGACLGWNLAQSYLLRSIPHHALAGDAIDLALLDREFVLHADLTRLITAAAAARSIPARNVATLIRRTAHAIDQDAAGRLAAFIVTEVADSLPTGFDKLTIDVPYRAIWASVRRRSDHSTLIGHVGRVNAVCTVEVDAASLLASAGNDATIRIWNPASGVQDRLLIGHSGRVNALCVIEVDGRSLIASAGDDATIRIWDPESGAQLRSLMGHTGWVNALCVVEVAGRPVLASAGNDATIRIWDPESGAQLRSLMGHTGWVNALCVVEVAGRPALASAGNDATIRIWNTESWTGEQELIGHTGRITALCVVDVAGHAVLASASRDASVRLWDTATGLQTRSLTGHADWVNGLCAVDFAGQTMVASASRDASVRLWDPIADAHKPGRTHHTGPVKAICVVRVADRTLVATASSDATIRLWDPDAAEREQEVIGHTGWVNALSVFDVNGSTNLASASSDATVRLWDPENGTPEHRVASHPGPVQTVSAMQVDGRSLLAFAGSDRRIQLWDPVAGTYEDELISSRGTTYALCPIEVGGRQLLASAGHDNLVRIWDLETRTERLKLVGHTDWVRALCVIEVGGRRLLASAGNDATVRLWDPLTGGEDRVLTGHTGWIRSLCVVQTDDQTLIATASHDATVRIWDPATGRQELELVGHTGPVRAVCAFMLGTRAMLGSASTDRSVRLWDAKTGARVLTIPLANLPRAIASASADMLHLGMDVGVLAVRLASRLGDGQ